MKVARLDLEMWALGGRGHEGEVVIGLVGRLGARAAPGHSLAQAQQVGEALGLGELALVLGPGVLLDLAETGESEL